MKPLQQGDTYTKQIHDELERVLKGHSTLLNKLPEEGTVYIGSSKIPKREFKRLYPQYPQTNDPTKATFSIVSDASMYFPGGYLSSGIGNPITSKYLLKTINESIEDYNKVICRNIILDTSIKFNSDKEPLTPEIARNIRNLLGSRDVETFKLGFTLLFNHDYEKEKDLFVLCIASANHYSWYKRERTTLSKNIISKIKKDFPNIKF